MRPKGKRNRTRDYDEALTSSLLSSVMPSFPSTVPSYSAHSDWLLSFPLGPCQAKYLSMCFSASLKRATSFPTTHAGTHTSPHPAPHFCSFRACQSANQAFFFFLSISSSLCPGAQLQLQSSSESFFTPHFQMCYVWDVAGKMQTLRVDVCGKP